VPTLITNNLMLGLIFLPGLFLSRQPWSWSHLHQPVITGTAFFAGQLCNFLALRHGDVSVVTPLMGTKVTFVALLGLALFRVALTPPQILAACLTTLGVLVMGVTDRRPGSRGGVGTLFALGSGFHFALCDTFIQQWAGGADLFTFMPLLFGTVAVESAMLLPWHGGAWRQTPRPAWPWLGTAALLTAVQAVIITSTIAWSHDATGVNVVYSLRGVIGLALVWFIGRQLGNHERRDAGGRAMFWRLTGSLLLLTAVVLAVLGSRQPHP